MWSLGVVQVGVVFGGGVGRGRALELVKSLL